MNKFYDLYVPGYNKEFERIKRELEIYTAPGDFSLLISNDAREIIKNRKKFFLIASMPKDRQEFMRLINLTQIDYFIIEYKLHKKEIRFSKRMEKPILLDFHPFFEEDYKKCKILIHNLRLLQEFNGLFIISSGAEKIEELRSGRDLASIAILFDLKPDLAYKSVSKIPEFIIERSKQRHREIAPFVEVIE